MKSLLFMFRRESLFTYYYVSFNGIEQYGKACFSIDVIGFEPIAS